MQDFEASSSNTENNRQGTKNDQCAETEEEHRSCSGASDTKIPWADTEVMAVSVLIVLVIFSRLNFLQTLVRIVFLACRDELCFVSLSRVICLARFCF